MAKKENNKGVLLVALGNHNYGKMAVQLANSIRYNSPDINISVVTNMQLIGFDFDKVTELLNLPKDHTPAMFVCIGKAIKGPMPRGGQLPLHEVVIENQFK